MTLRNLVLILALNLCACANMTYSSEYASTVKAIGQAEEACTKFIHDGPSAQKECFPLLTDKRLLIRVEDISTGALRSIKAHAGRDNNFVYCEPTKKDMDRIMANPGLVKPGEKYWVTGSFSNFSKISDMHFYTLENCKFEVLGDK